ncbi:MAG: transposase [Desulfobacteraceae bacterium]|nr:transposase [Desulfobacteraceae bacterium]
MARPLRIEYPDAWYHIMNRGRRGEDIFADDHDYKMFTDLLHETSEMWNVRIAAYCLMPNHYHMLLQTPNANISRSMRHLNGVYTQRYNSRHKYDGQLFRGRYKSILIDTDSYLLQAIRYIHRNPVRAGLVEKIDAYKWSSHKGYLSIAGRWDWLYKNYILSLLSRNRNDWMRHYRRWVSVEEEDEVSQKISGVKWPVCLGPQEFIDRIREKYGSGKINKEIPSIRELLPDKKRIVDEICRYYGVKNVELMKVRRGRRNDARNAAIYLTRKLRLDTFKEIGKQYNIDNDRTVRSVVERMKKRLSSDRDLDRKMGKLQALIKRSQKWT